MHIEPSGDRIDGDAFREICARGSNHLFGQTRVARPLPARRRNGIDISPVFALNCPEHGGFGDAVLPSHGVCGAALGVSKSALSNEFFGQFGFVMPLACEQRWRAVAMLIAHVLMIVFERAEKQVGRINAGWRIASMKNTRAIRYWTNVKRVTNTMRQPLSDMSGADEPVSHVVLVGKPEPTIIGASTRKFLLESLKQGCFRATGHTLTTTSFDWSFPIISKEHQGFQCE